MKLYILSILLFIGVAIQAQSIDSLSATPNSFNKNSVMKVYFNLTQNDTVSLCVYNRWGEEIKCIYKDTVLEAGEYTNDLSIRDSLKNGTYLLGCITKSNGSKGLVINRYDSTATITKVITVVSKNNNAITFNKDVLNVAIAKIKKVVIYNIEGKEMASYMANETNAYDLRFLTSGIYIINVHTNDTKIITKKIWVE